MIVPSSRLVFWTAAVAVPAALAAAAVPAVAGAAWAAVGVLAVAALADAVQSAGYLRRLTVDVPGVVRLSRDQDGVIPLRLGEVHRPFRNLRVGLALPEELGSRQEDLRTDLPEAGMDYHVAWACRPVRRGRYERARCGLECDSAWGLWMVRRRLDVTADLRVYPNLRSERRRAAAQFLNRGGMGVHRWRQVGKGREFEKLREYVPGDSLDDIHWKATARRRHPITKVFQIERTQEIYVVLDSSRLSARPAPSTTAGAPGEGPEAPANLLDRYIAAGLLLGRAAESQGDRFGLIEFNGGVRGFIRAGRGKAHFDACRNALCTLMPGRVSPDFAELFAFVGTRLRKRALLVVLTSLDDTVVAEGFLRAVDLVRRKHLVAVAMMRPPGAHPLFTDNAVQSVEEVCRRLEGHETWRRLRETEQALRQMGVLFELMDPRQLSAGLIAQYMSIKQRQMI